MSVGTPSVSSLTGLQANKRKWPEKVNNKWVKQTISVQSCVLSVVIGIAWAVHHIGACAAHMLSKSRVRVFIVVQMHIISRHTHNLI